MAIRFDIDRERGLGLGTAEGDITLEEMKSAAVAMWSRLGVQDKRILWDLRGARFDLAADQVRELAEFIRERSPGGGLRTAFVVESELEFGLVRMFSALRETGEASTQAFRDRRTALAWLDSGGGDG